MDFEPFVIVSTLALGSTEMLKQAFVTFAKYPSPGWLNQAFAVVSSISWTMLFAATTFAARFNFHGVPYNKLTTYDLVFAALFSGTGSIVGHTALKAVDNKSTIKFTPEEAPVPAAPAPADVPAVPTENATNSTPEAEPVAPPPMPVQGEDEPTFAIDADTAAQLMAERNKAA